MSLEVYFSSFANAKIFKWIWEQHENHMLKFDSCDQMTIEIC